MGYRESRLFVPMPRAMKTIGASVALESLILCILAAVFVQGFP
jgi:hypothetical protein